MTFAGGAAANAQDSIINTGTIVVESGGIGIAIAGNVINQGAIVQTGGLLPADGVYAFSLENSGTISVDGIAVQTRGDISLPLSYIINSGLIESRKSIAISPWRATQINNLASGTISGDMIAISTGSYATLVNAGTINGDVELNRLSLFSGQAQYVADGGILNGALRFNLGGTLLAPGETGETGISGAIDAGSGEIKFGYYFRNSATTAVDQTLTDQIRLGRIEAIGPDTIVTLTNPVSTPDDRLIVAGDGQILNRADLAGPVVAVADAPLASDGIGILKAFTNEGTMAGGFAGYVSSFVNHGTIGNGDPLQASVGMTAPGDLEFANTGTITGAGTSVSSTNANRFVATNSGNMLGGFNGSALLYGENAPFEVTVSNSGTVGSIDGDRYGSNFDLLVWAKRGTGSVIVSNSGMIKTDAPGSAAASLFAEQSHFFLEEHGTYSSIRIENSGTIRSTGDGIRPSPLSNILSPSVAVLLQGNAGTPMELVNTASGAIAVTGDYAVAVQSTGPALQIENAGTISGGPTTRFSYEAFGPSGSYTVDVALAGAVQGSFGDDTIVSSGTIIGSIDLADGDDSIVNVGSINGDVSLGSGNDSFTIEHGSSVAGTVDGGAGFDKLTLNLPSTTIPTPMDLSNFISFEELSLERGTVSFSGTNAFDTVNINAGQWIGLAGSTISASNGFHVASGATFGSKGTVIGNLVVAGTLSPGASPGTMTVTGNVALANGSTSLFEITPGVSDKLVISGSLNIAHGATLRLTGTRPLTPGVALDLIVADGGITGSFSTIDKSEAIAGFLSQSATKLQLLGTFLTDPSFSPQVNGTIEYLNDVLISGQASAAVLAATPDLLMSTGASNPATFHQMAPEAYASASQLGTEQALAVVDAARAQIMTVPTRSGLFAFGQGLSNHHEFDEDSARGISGAAMQSYGGLVGLGMASDSGWIGAFVGYLDGRQTIESLGARTDADGMIVGVQGALRLGMLRIDALGAYSGGDATTHRSVAGDALAGTYKLHSWTGDVRASYDFPIGRGWAVRPSAGLTGIRTLRGSPTESGNSPFALAVESNQRTSWFVDGSVTLQGRLGDDERFSPYVALGMRQLIKGSNSKATASLIGVSENYTLPGIERDRSMVTARLGMSYALTPKLRLFAGYAGDYANDTRHEVSVGMRLMM